MRPSMLTRFMEQYDGQVVNFDGHPESAGQSVQLVAAWCHFLGLPFQWTVPWSWWDDADETFLEYWHKYEYAENSEVRPKPGDIVIFNNDLPGTDDGGHAAIYVEEDTDVWTGFESAWGSKSARLNEHNFAYVAGWFSPANPQVLQGNCPTKIAELLPADAYDADPIASKLITFEAERVPLYNLNDLTFDTFHNSPIGYAYKGEEVIVTAIARHRFGGTFYLPDIDRPEGYAVSDCGDEPAEQPLPTEESFVKAASELFAPIGAPSKEDVVYIKKEVPRYKSVSAALRHPSTTITFPAGKYFVYNRLHGMMSLTRELGVPESDWLNPDDLIERDWHDSLYRFPDGPRYFQARHGGYVHDLEYAGKKYPILKHQPILIAGTMTGPDKKNYWVPDNTLTKGKLYGVPEDLLHDFVDYPTEEKGEPTVIYAEHEPSPESSWHGRLLLGMKYRISAARAAYKGKDNVS